MSEETSMFELLNERMEKEDILKLVCNYDNKFNELEEENKKLKYQLQQKENIINEVREDLDKQITFCTNEANGTTNDKYCRIAIQYLKHLKDKIQESKDNESC